MVSEKKRPRGLKGSAAAKANKKLKSEDNTVTADIPANAQTVVIDKEVEEGDEIGETVALFENAMQKIDEDPTAALSLIRGTIHESDRILRNWDSENPLPPLFYLTYGSALYELGRITDDEDFEQYLEAAEERLNDGLADKDMSDDVKSKYQLYLIKIWFAKAANDISPTQQNVPELSIKALDTLNQLDHINFSSKTMIELADIVLNHGDLFDEIDARDKFIGWSVNTLKRILEEEPNNAEAMAAMGASELVIGNYWLDQLDKDGEEDEEEEEKTSLNEIEKKAFDAFVESRKYFKSAKDELAKDDLVTPKILSDLAESYLNEANLILDEEQQKEAYNEAASAIKEAKSLIEDKKLDYSLPEELVSFLDELEE